MYIKSLAIISVSVCTLKIYAVVIGLQLQNNQVKKKKCEESTDIIFLREELSTEINLELSFTIFLKTDQPVHSQTWLTFLLGKRIRS